MRSYLVALLGVACFGPAPAFAQRGGNDSGLPRVGSQLPDIQAFDADGREFSLSELRGEYSVLVFGCLT